MLTTTQREQWTIQREISHSSVASLKPGADETSLIHELIAQYLAHDGYVETARAFAAEVREESHALATGGTSTAKDLEPEEDVDAMNRQSRWNCWCRFSLLTVVQKSEPQYSMETLTRRSSSRQPTIPLCCAKTRVFTLSFAAASLLR